jgi:hypothetical protein
MNRVIIFIRCVPFLMLHWLDNREGISVTTELNGMAGAQPAVP